MRLLSLWQPWASAIALGHKSIETRSWSTPYRGLVAIHAAKVPFKPSDYDPYFKEEKAFLDRLKEDGLYDLHLAGGLPYGAVVAVARLIDCGPTSRLTCGQIVTEKELVYGNYEEGRYGWLFTDIQPLRVPLPFRGAQGLRPLPQDAVELINTRVSVL